MKLEDKHGHWWPSVSTGVQECSIKRGLSAFVNKCARLQRVAGLGVDNISELLWIP